MNRDQLADQLRVEIVRVRAVGEADGLVDNYALKIREMDRNQALARAENALNLLDSTAMERSLEALRRIT